jgi:hypothetical protein
VSQVTDTYLAETEQDVQGLQATHEAFKVDLPNHLAEFEKLSASNAELTQLGCAENPYSTHSFEVCVCVGISVFDLLCCVVSCCAVLCISLLCTVS